MYNGWVGRWDMYFSGLKGFVELVRPVEIISPEDTYTDYEKLIVII